MKFRSTFCLAVALGFANLIPLSAQEESKLEVPPVTLIQNVHAWDGTSDTLKKDHDVLIVGDKIKKVAPDIPTEGTVEVDAVRKTMQRVADAPGFEAGNYQFNVTGEDGKVERVAAEVTVIDGKGGYLPDNDAELTHLGTEQWAWWEKELQKPADLRLICSSTQVIPDQKGMDEWGNFPHERRRLIDLARTAGNAVLLGSNVHFAEISRDDSTGILELTSSGMTHINETYGAAPNRYRIGEPMVALNFSLIEIDWQAQTMTLGAAGLAGKLLIQHTVSLDDLSP